MLKKTVTYKDFNGVERTEDFYFNLTRSEITEMEVGTEGGFVEKLQRIVAAKDGKQIMETFKEIILKSYGEKSLDGKRFIKSKEISEAFYQTAAYSDIFMELCTDSDAAAKFINGIVPESANK